jgi:hypothetical protein
MFPAFFAVSKLMQSAQISENEISAQWLYTRIDWISYHCTAFGVGIISGAYTERMCRHLLRDSRGTPCKRELQSKLQVLPVAFIISCQLQGKDRSSVTEQHK